MSQRNAIEGNEGVYQGKMVFVKPAIDRNSFYTEIQRGGIIRGTERVEPTKARPRVATNVSEIEKVLPWIYGQEPREIGVSVEKGGVFGEKLHELHLICNLIAHDNTGVNVAHGLPTANEAVIKKVQKITDGLYLTRQMGHKQIEEVLTIAWQRCVQETAVEPGTLPMFGNLGFMNPKTKEGYQHSSDLFEVGVKFIESWARLIVAEGDNGFNPANQSVSEVLVVINTSLLQLRGRLDTVTRIAKPGKKVMIELSDLKTGTGEARTELEREIKKRQAQMMLFMAERFGARFLLGNKWLEHTGSAFVINAATETWRGTGRCRFSYLRFDQKTGEFQKEVIEMTNDDRLEFATWLGWYGEKLREYKQRVTRGFQI